MPKNDRKSRNTATLSLRSPGDLLAELPGLLGYHPVDSLVTVLTQDRTLRCVMRMDLDQIDDEAADRIISVANRAEADTVYAVVYAKFAGEDLPHHSQIDDLHHRLDESGVHLADVLLVDDARYWSYLCQDLRCCPPEGRPIRGGTPVLEAERVRSGLPAVVESRREAASVYRARPDLEPTPDALRAAELLLSRPTEARGRIAVEAVRSLAQLLDDGQLGLDPVDDQLDDTLRAALVTLIQDIQVRDLLLGTFASSPGSLDGPVEVLIRAAITAPEEMRPRIAATAAALLAADGTNPVALWAMVDLAEDESLAALVQAGVEQGFPPDLVRGTFAEALPTVRERLTAS